ncbi:hypothetical protein C5612_05700 [Pseudomonas frederiksbergensis]|uniref:Uncharacterized protein n=1 Tax=Pseudomonas frederiksbergensis TaxID=104087 RepID=A0A2S8HRW5_9PSED|nr:hypothetical protein C5612_05700 [Pseudomonas frederiksbergensis]
MALRGLNVGAGLLAKAVCQSPSMLPVIPLSRASPLPQGFVSAWGWVPEADIQWAQLLFTA